MWVKLYILVLKYSKMSQCILQVSSLSSFLQTYEMFPWALRIRLIISHVSFAVLIFLTIYWQLELSEKLKRLKGAIKYNAMRKLTNSNTRIVLLAERGIKIPRIKFLPSRYFWMSLPTLIKEKICIAVHSVIFKHIFMNFHFVLKAEKRGNVFGKLSNLFLLINKFS